MTSPGAPLSRANVAPSSRANAAQQVAAAAASLIEEEEWDPESSPCFNREWMEKLQNKIKQGAWSYPEDSHHTNPDDIHLMLMLQRCEMATSMKDRAFWGANILTEIQIRKSLHDRWGQLVNYCLDVGVELPPPATDKAIQDVAFSMVEDMKRDRWLGIYLDLGIYKRAPLCAPAIRTLSSLLQVTTKTHILTMMDHLTTPLEVNKYHCNTGYGLLEQNHPV